MLLKKLIVIAGLAGTLGVAAPAFAAGWHSGGAVRGGGGVRVGVGGGYGYRGGAGYRGVWHGGPVYRPIARPGYGYGVAAPGVYSPGYYGGYAYPPAPVVGWGVRHHHRYYRGW